MASKSHRNITSIITMCRGMAHIIQDDRPNNPVLRKLTDRLIEACKAAQAQWIDGLTIDDTRVVARELEAYESSTFPREWHAAFLSSLCLGLMDDLMEPRRDGERPLIQATLKRHAVDKVRGALEKLHDYHDRTGRKWGVYVEADRAVDIWWKLREA